MACVKCGGDTHGQSWPARSGSGEICTDCWEAETADEWWREARSRGFHELPAYVRLILRDPDITAYMERHPDAEPHDAMLAVIDRLRRQVEILIDALHKAQHALDALAKPYADASHAIDRVFSEIAEMEREV
jgi:hypothetical protein